MAERRLVAEHAAHHELRPGPLRRTSFLPTLRGSVEAWTTSCDASAIDTSSHPELAQLLRVGLHDLLQVGAARRLLLGDLDGGRQLLGVVADPGEERALAEEVEDEEAADGEGEQRQHHQLQPGPQRPAAQPPEERRAHVPSLDPARHLRENPSLDPLTGPG